MGDERRKVAHDTGVEIIKSHIRKSDPPKAIYTNKGLFHPLPIGFGLDALNSNVVSKRKLLA